ncbi:leucyl aminopeptidase family protein [Solimonas terrae]|uniref:Leucyl aminopeptidase family protein n=1 Tax=Solimonas terrae TaxID=1396819 RepID=A0A6M2BJY4_9GAMM|nr:leucyl aminopeptidase family protein [Solimonas terrae]NGY03242.1 leucyl aminopeptidase family protein [Solimonas terrae]
MKAPLIPIDRLQKFDVAPAARKAAPLRVALVDHHLQSLSVLSDRRQLPSLPAHFRGLPGERWTADDVLVIGCGAVPAADAAALYWHGVAWQVGQALQAGKIAVAELLGVLPKPIAQDFATGFLLAGYDNDLYRSVPARNALKSCVLRMPGLDRRELARARATAEAVNWARALVDAPANYLTPAAFADEALALAPLGIKVKVLNEAALRKLGAHGLLAVGSSSPHKPCMVVAQWKGRAAAATDLAIVGKGLTFDGGGLNLKMMLIEKMKFDMGGAAAALAALRLIASRKLAVNVAIVLPLCENIIAGDAYRPGDVIGSLEGLTIEVANTDAEGRIVLADGLSYAKRFKPGVLVDIATLTGSISMTLHQEFAGLYANDEALAQQISQAAEQSGDLVWRMPLSPLQDYLVDSDIADVRNLGAGNGLGLPAGSSSIAGAKFLQRFVGEQRWAHLDMASTVLSSRQRGAVRPGPTGWGVRLLVELSQSLSNKPARGA